MGTHYHIHSERTWHNGLNLQQIKWTLSKDACWRATKQVTKRPGRLQTLHYLGASVTVQMSILIITSFINKFFFFVSSFLKTPCQKYLVLPWLFLHYLCTYMELYLNTFDLHHSECILQLIFDIAYCWCFIYTNVFLFMSVYVIIIIM